MEPPCGRGLQAAGLEGGLLSQCALRYDPMACSDDTSLAAELWQIMEKYLASGWLHTQVQAIYSEIEGAAREDDSKWHRGDIDKGVAALLAQFSERKIQLFSQYRSMFSPFVDTDHSATATARSGVNDDASTWAPAPASAAATSDDDGTADYSDGQQ